MYPDMQILTSCSRQTAIQGKKYDLIPPLGMVVRYSQQCHLRGVCVCVQRRIPWARNAFKSRGLSWLLPATLGTYHPSPRSTPSQVWFLAFSLNSPGQNSGSVSSLMCACHLSTVKLVSFSELSSQSWKSDLFSSSEDFGVSFARLPFLWKPFSWQVQLPRSSTLHSLPLSCSLLRACCGFLPSIYQR